MPGKSVWPPKRPTGQKRAFLEELGAFEVPFHFLVHKNSKKWNLLLLNGISANFKFGYFSFIFNFKAVVLGTPSLCSANKNACLSWWSTHSKISSWSLRMSFKVLGFQGGVFFRPGSHLYTVSCLYKPDRVFPKTWKYSFKKSQGGNGGLLKPSFLSIEKQEYNINTFDSIPDRIHQIDSILKVSALWVQCSWCIWK